MIYDRAITPIARFVDDSTISIAGRRGTSRRRTSRRRWRAIEQRPCCPGRRSGRSCVERSMRVACERAVERREVRVREGREMRMTFEEFGNFALRRESA